MRAGVLVIIAGVLLLVSGATSSTLLFDNIGEFVEERFPDAGGAVELTLKVLSFMAAFGGLTVIVGGVLMLLGLDRIGRLVTVIAAVLALVGFVLLLGLVIDRGEGAYGWLVDGALILNALGIVLAFWARP